MPEHNGLAAFIPAFCRQRFRPRAVRAVIPDFPALSFFTWRDSRDDGIIVVRFPNSRAGCLCRLRRPSQLARCLMVVSGRVIPTNRSPVVAGGCSELTNRSSLQPFLLRRAGDEGVAAHHSPFNGPVTSSKLFEIASAACNKHDRDTLSLSLKMGHACPCSRRLWLCSPRSSSNSLSRCEAFIRFPVCVSDVVPKFAGL